MFTPCPWPWLQRVCCGAWHSARLTKAVTFAAMVAAVDVATLLRVPNSQQLLRSATSTYMHVLLHPCLNCHLMYDSHAQRTLDKGTAPLQHGFQHQVVHSAQQGFCVWRPGQAGVGAARHITGVACGAVAQALSAARPCEQQGAGADFDPSKGLHEVHARLVRLD